MDYILCLGFLQTVPAVTERKNRFLSNTVDTSGPITVSSLFFHISSAVYSKVPIFDVYKAEVSCLYSVSLDDTHSR